MLAHEAKELSSCSHTGGFHLFSPEVGTSHHNRGDCVEKPYPTLRKLSLCRKCRNDQTKIKWRGAQNIQLEINIHNSKEEDSQKISKFKYQNTSLSYTDIPCLLGHVVEVQRPVAACLAVQSQKFKHFNVACYSSHYKSTPQPQWSVLTALPNTQLAPHTAPRTNTKFLISFSSKLIP